MISHRSRMMHQHHRPQQLQPLQLSASTNPEEMATSNLLRISNEQYDPMDFDLYSSPQSQSDFPNKSACLPPKAPAMRKINSCGNYQTKKPRVSVVENFTECFEISRRKTSFQLNAEEHKEPCPKNVLSTSNFLVLSQEKYKNIKLLQSRSTEHCSQQKTSSRSKPSINVSYILIKRNKSLLKQYLQLHKDSKQPMVSKRASTPIHIRAHSNHINFNSFKEVQEPSSPIRITSPSKIDPEHKRQYRCINGNFSKVGSRKLRYLSKDAHSNNKR